MLTQRATPKKTRARTQPLCYLSRAPESWRWAVVLGRGLAVGGRLIWGLPARVVSGGGLAGWPRGVAHE